MSEENQQKSNKKKYIIWGIVAFFIIGGIGSLFTDEEEQETEQASTEQVESEEQANEEDEENAAETEEATEEENTDENETDQSNDVEQTVNEFAENEFNMEEINNITVEENENGHNIAIDYNHVDNADGFAYIRQIEILLENLTNELEDENISELEYVANANLVRDGEDVTDTVYEVKFNDISNIDRDNVEEQADHHWTNEALE